MYRLLGCQPTFPVTRPPGGPLPRTWHFRWGGAGPSRLPRASRGPRHMCELPGSWTGALGKPARSGVVDCQNLSQLSWGWGCFLLLPSSSRRVRAQAPPASGPLPSCKYLKYLSQRNADGCPASGGRAGPASSSSGRGRVCPVLRQRFSGACSQGRTRYLPSGTRGSPLSSGCSGVSCPRPCFRVGVTADTPGVPSAPSPRLFTSQNVWA